MKLDMETAKEIDSELKRSIDKLRELETKVRGGTKLKREIVNATINLVRCKQSVGFELERLRVD